MLIHQIIALIITEFICFLYIEPLIKLFHGILDLAGKLSLRLNVLLIILHFGLPGLLHAIHQVVFLDSFFNMDQFERDDTFGCVSEANVPDDEPEPVPDHCLPLFFDVLGQSSV